jgi:hypothetical protein
VPNYPNGRKIVEQVPAIFNGPKPFKKLSKRALEGQRVREDNQYEFFVRVVEDVTLAVRKYMPSLDWEQGGAASDDVESNPTFKQRLLQIRKNGYHIGTRTINVRGRAVVKEMYRFPTPKEMRDALRFAVDELRYVRKAIVAEEGDGVSSRLKTKKVAAERVQHPLERQKRKFTTVKRPLQRPTLTARAPRKRRGR